MSSDSRFSFSRIFGRSNARAKDDAGFVPRTAIAARIIGQERVAPSVQDTTADEPLNSFDLGHAGQHGGASDLVADQDAASRLADRFVPLKASTTITDTRGRAIKARIMNISATGVAVEADFAAMPPDSVTHVGQKPVLPGRTIRGGRVFVFTKPLDPARCNPSIVL